MKKLITIIALTAMFVSAFAKSVSPSKVPDIIKTNFKNAYPDAEVIKWESTTVLDYKVEFKVGNSYGAAFYDNKGNFIEDDQTIEWRKVPLTGRIEIYHLGQNKIMNVLKIQNSKNETFYQIDLKNHFKRQEVLLDQEGNIIRKF